MEYVVTTKEKFDEWVKKEDDEYEEKIKEWKERVKEQEAEIQMELDMIKRQQELLEQYNKAQQEGPEAEDEDAKKPKVKKYGLDMELMAKSDEEKLKVLQPSQYFDYKLYSHLINELRAVGGHFAELKESELSNFERNIVKQQYEYMERAKDMCCLYPSEDVKQYIRLNTRRYQNELVGCCLRNGIYDKLTEA